MTSRLGFHLLVLMGLLPILIPRWLPLQDYPQHLLISKVIAHQGDPQSPYAENFSVDLKPLPYLGMYGLSWLLGGLLPVTVIGRIALLIYFLTTPYLVRAYTGEVAPGSESAAIAAVPALYGSLYYFGFVNFLMGVPAVFAAPYLLLKYRRTGKRNLLLLFLLVSLYAYGCHLLDLVLLALASLALSLTPGKRRRTAAASALLPWLLIGLAWLLLPAMPKAGIGYIPYGENKIPYGQSRPFQFLSPITDLLFLLAYIARDSSMIDAALYGIPVGAILIAAYRYRMTGRRTPKPPDGATPWFARLILPLLCTLLLFLLPGSTPLIDCVNLKMTVFVFLALPSLIPARLLDRRTVASLLAFAFLSQAATLWTHVRFDQEAREFDGILESIPTGRRIMTAILHPGSDALLWIAPYAHYGAMVPLLRGGVSTGIFQGPQIPVRMTAPGTPSIASYLREPDRIREVILEARSRWLVVRATEREIAIIPKAYRLVRRSGRFWLFRLTTPDFQSLGVPRVKWLPRIESPMLFDGQRPSAGSTKLDQQRHHPPPQRPTAAKRQAKAAFTSALRRTTSALYLSTKLYAYFGHLVQ